MERPYEQVIETPVYIDNVIERYYEELVEVRGHDFICWVSDCVLTFLGSNIHRANS